MQALAPNHIQPNPGGVLGTLPPRAKYLATQGETPPSASLCLAPPPSSGRLVFKQKCAQMRTNAFRGRKQGYHKLNQHTFVCIGDVSIVQENEIKYIGIRVTPETHKKLGYIAKYHDRTVSGLALHLFNKCIRDFEKEHGPIRQEDMEA